MMLKEVAVTGTLKPDGSLELDEKPGLPPGRVKILLCAEFHPTERSEEEGLLEFMQNARSRMLRAGCHFMDEQEVQEHVAWLHQSDPIDDLLRDENAS